MTRALSIRERECVAEGCERLCKNTYGYCKEHFGTALKCYFDDCDGRVPANTRSRLCSEHRHLHNKLRLDRGDES